MAVLLQINVEVNYGSTGRIAEHIGKLAIKDGWKSYIAYGRIKKESSSELIPIGDKLGHLNHLVQTRMFDRHGLASTRATKKFIAKIEEIKPTLIQLHNIHGYYINIELLFEFLSTAGIPVVLTLHDCWALTGHCTHFEHIGCEKWMTECNACPQSDTYPASWIADRSTANHQLKKTIFKKVKNLTLVTVSEWLQKTVQKSFLSMVPSTVIRNGIDISIFKPRNTDILKEKFQLKDKFIILGVASVWSTNKGLQDFVQLSSLLSDDDKIVLIGLNKKQIASLPANIIGIERTDNIEGLAEWYSVADIYVNTSVEESFGLTTAEAMACGTPVIVYNSTANPEMVTDEVGHVNAKNNIQELNHNILDVKRKGKKSFTEACRHRAITKYDKNNSFIEYIKLYQKLIS